MADEPESWRCFIGLPLPDGWRPGLARVCGRLAGRLRSRITWTQPENLHLTLKFLGDVECVRLPGIRAALARVDFAPLDLRLGGAGSFGAGPASRAPRTLWAGLAQGGDEVARLAADIEAALGGGRPEGRGGAAFRPHVTLGRVRRVERGDDWGLVDRELGGESFASAWVERFVLWRSILGRGVPKYVALEAYPARNAAGTGDRA